MLVFFVSLVSCAVLILLLRGVAHRLGIVDYPGGRKQHVQPTPTVGGLAMYLAVLLTLLWHGGISENVAVLLGCAAALVMLGVPLRRVVHKVQAAREKRYESLRGFFPGASDEGPESMQIRLHTVALTERARAVGKTLESLHLHELDVDVTTVRRGMQRLVPDQDMLLQTSDIIVVRGSAESVARAEQRLLK